MAIYHCSCKIISRSSGRSSVGASAYRSGERLTNNYDDVTHDYTKKDGVVYSEIMLSENAPKEYQNRETLWNAVEKKEGAKNSQLAREYELALPNELSIDEQIKLVQDYTKDNFINNGMCADVAIHDKKDGNPHAHIMLTVRPIEKDGTWGEKQKKEYILDRDGNKQYDKQKQTYKCRTIKTTNWDSVEFLEERRKNWAVVVNKELERKGLTDRVDHRSYEEQGKEQIPTIHMGAEATQMERRGIRSERGKINEEIRTINSTRAELTNSLEERTAILNEIENLEQQAQEAVASAEDSAKRTEKAVVTQNVTAAVQFPIADGTTDGRVVVTDLRKQLPTAERIAEKLIALKTEYIELELQIHKQQNGVGIKDEVRQIDNQIKDITEIKGYINSQDEQITRLYRERSRLGIFDGKKKRSIDDEIARYERVKAQLGQELQRVYQVMPTSIDSKIQELQQQADTILKKGTEFDVISLHKRKGDISRQYSQEMNRTATAPLKTQIRGLIAEHRHNMSGLSIAERSVIAKAETELNKAVNIGKTQQHNKSYDIDRE